MVTTLKYEKIARRYARAYLRAYKEVLTEQDIERVSDFLTGLKQQPAFVAYLTVPSLSESQKMSLVEKKLTEYRVHHSFRSLVSLLIQQKRPELLSTVVSCFLEEYDADKGVLFFSITTSARLSDEEKRLVLDSLVAKFNARVKVSFEVVDSLIYGIRLRSKGLLFDNSVARKLKEAQQELLRQVKI